jgi:hypothetical protein
MSREFRRLYGFDVWIETDDDTIRYRCLTCSLVEHGGGRPNVGLPSRMKQHLRENHPDVDVEPLKREHVERGDMLVQVWFGVDGPSESAPSNSA